MLIQHATLREIDVYRRAERAAVIRRSAAVLARRREELFVVSDVETAAMRLTGCLHGRRRVFRVEAMPAQLRRITVIDSGRGMEPMALFAGRGGRMLTKQRWEQVFAAAYSRAVRIAAEHFLPVEMPRRFRIHDLRHTFAVFMLQQLTELAIEAERSQRDAGGHGGYLADHIARNPLLIVQRLLGHRAPSSTMRYLTYLGQTKCAGRAGSGRVERRGGNLRRLRGAAVRREGPLMPRRGEHHAVRAAQPAAAPAASTETGGQAGPGLRLGVRPGRYVTAGSRAAVNCIDSS